MLSSSEASLCYPPSCIFRQVGQAVIQIAAAKGINTINLVRNRCVHWQASVALEVEHVLMRCRDNIGELKSSLEKLGATHVLTYDELADKSVREKIKGWTQGKVCTHTAYPPPFVD